MRKSIVNRRASKKVTSFFRSVSNIGTKIESEKTKNNKKEKGGTHNVK